MEHERERELPLRIIEQPGGALAIRCTCGAEAAAARGLELRADASPAALIKMVLHARRHG